MTLDEIKSLPHIIIKEETDKYTHIDTEDGYKLTFWNENDNIDEFNSFRCVYLPKMKDYPAYRIISEEENEKLINRQEEYQRQEDEKMMRPVVL